MSARREMTMTKIWIAYAQHCTNAFQAATEKEARNLARRWVAINRPFANIIDCKRLPLWRSLAREGWRCVRINGGENE